MPGVQELLAASLLLVIVAMPFVTSFLPLVAWVLKLGVMPPLAPGQLREASLRGDHGSLVPLRRIAPVARAHRQLLSRQGQDSEEPRRGCQSTSVQQFWDLQVSFEALKVDLASMI